VPNSNSAPLSNLSPYTTLFRSSVASGQYYLTISGDLGSTYLLYSGNLDLSSSVAENLTLQNLHLDASVSDSAGNPVAGATVKLRSGEHTSELQSQSTGVWRLRL